MNATLIAKAKAGWCCEECGSTEFVAAHHQIPGDDSSIIVLCGKCHSQEHPNVPKQLFFTKAIQQYWVNKSAASIAKLLKVHPRTIIRRARKLGIERGYISEYELRLLIESIKQYQAPKQKQPTQERPLPSLLQTHKAGKYVHLTIPKRIHRTCNIMGGTPFRYSFEGKRLSIEQEAIYSMYPCRRSGNRLYLHIPVKLAEECRVTLGTRFLCFLKNGKLIIEQEVSNAHLGSTSPKKQ